ncbi:DHH family phosphoesterase [Solobacterium moorei]|uniref:DHH family phosphoesterase n=1 Tax=Solobacterium moorei TaxID=102148 RepID=UPI0024ADD882|nr:DHH family phosphoesterase [Solobacterium moorei]MDI6414878.1 DHH family phosphoesterase [Solobacterium moorei]
MQQKMSRIKQIVFVALAIQLAVIILLQLIFKINILPGILVLIVEALITVYLLDYFQSANEEESIGLEKYLGGSYAEAYLVGGVGMMNYDENYVITWQSELFKERGLDRIGSKLLTWLPEANDIISGETEKVSVTIDQYVYEVSKRENAPTIFFKDITLLNKYRGKYNEEHVVLGLASFDNYEESTMYADDADIANINATIRTPLNEYFQKFGVFLRRLNNNRYLLVLNEKIYREIAADRFSILNIVRKASQKAEVSITLSMAFAKGSSNFAELDETVTKLMDLAQTRGGDQVAIQVVGEDVKYFGGSTEAAEKRSRVRVRVMAHALRDLIQHSSNVIICGHKNADFDCIGSAICLSKMASAFNKPVSIIAKTGGIEEKLDAAMKGNEKELAEDITFVTEGEAINQLKDDTLVIMTDHHNILQSNGAKLLEMAERIVVIDHHRRSTDMGVKPILIYIEAGASSTCEILTEMIPFVSSKVDISELEATFMLAGMTIDTRKWRERTGVRTYDAASALRKLGADPQVAYDYLKDTYDEFVLKSAIMNASERYPDGIVIAAVENEKITRSIMSQVADSLLSIQDVKAAFVIAQDKSTGINSISARSNGEINVQAIMEAMHGGGHMTAAATQRKDATVKELKEELINIIEQQKKEAEDESNS